MVVEKVYCRYVGEQSQRRGYVGESRMHKIRLCCARRRKGEGKGWEGPAAASRSPNGQRGQVTKTVRLYRRSSPAPGRESSGLGAGCASQEDPVTGRDWGGCRENLSPVSTLICKISKNLRGLSEFKT